MSLTLPRVVVVDAGSSRAHVSEAPPVGVLRSGEVELLVSRFTARNVHTVLRCEPLTGGRWAVGRWSGDTAVWRIVSYRELDRVGGHPAWLWTVDGWFDPGAPSTSEQAAPNAQPLRHLLRLAQRAVGNGAAPNTLAATVAALRTGRSTAVVVEPDALTARDGPVRWLALATLSLVPLSVRYGLRIQLGDDGSGPQNVDLVVTSGEPRGFAVVRAAAPSTSDSDVVAHYVRDRLGHDDPEALEAAAYLFDGADPEGGEDRWGQGIASLIRDGVAGTALPEQLDAAADPDRRLRQLVERLSGSGELEGGLLDELISTTRETADPRPWQALRRRPAVQRSRAVDALLQQPDRVRPSAGLLRELTTIFPRGASLEQWLPALLSWLDQGVATGAVLGAIQTTLLEWPDSVSASARAAAWVEVVAILGRLGQTDEAMDALARSPVSAEIAGSGAGEALVDAWSALPASARSTTDLKDVVGMLHGAPGGPRAVARLFELVKGNRAEAAALVDSWSRRAGASFRGDPVYEAVRATSAKAVLSGDVGGKGAGTPAFGPDDSAREHLLTLADNEPLTAAIEDGMLDIGEAALSEVRFPDLDIAAVAELLAGQRDTNRVWGWVALAAGAPGTWDDDTIDATVVAFCTEPPSDSRGTAIALQAARSLGAARSWDPIDHAQWVVRLALAPRGSLNQPLAQALLEGIGRRTDGTPFLADMFTALLELPPDHPATNWLLELLIPSGWRGERLARVLKSVPRDRVPHQLRDAWSALLAAAGAR
ncbi:MAG: hypothetical protein KTR31_39970 [Myxococcales bacterium]|nr:hypothetical protein [Myxococcales bacterium]